MNGGARDVTRLSVLVYKNPNPGRTTMVRSETEKAYFFILDRETRAIDDPPRPRPRPQTTRHRRNRGRTGRPIVRKAASYYRRRCRKRRPYRTRLSTFRTATHRPTSLSIQKISTWRSSSNSLFLSTELLLTFISLKTVGFIVNFTARSHETLPNLLPFVYRRGFKIHLHPKHLRTTVQYHRYF